MSTYFQILAFFHGQTVEIDGHRKDVGSMLPAKSSTAHMTAMKPGVWLLNCLVNDHYSAGMSALFNVTNCEKNFPKSDPLSGKTRKYFIAAEEVIWDYAPSGLDNFNGGNLTSEDWCVFELLVRINIATYNSVV